MGLSNPAARGLSVLALDGVDDRAHRGDLPAQLLGGAAKFVGGWVRTDASAIKKTLFHMGTDTSGGGPPGGQMFSLGVSEIGEVWVNVGQWAFDSTHIVPSEQWSYIFAFWDPAVGQYGLGTIEGGAVSKTYVTPGNSSSQKLAAGPLRFGGYPTPFARWPFGGELAEIALLDRVPSDAEILELAAGLAAPGSFAGLVAYWSLDQASGATAIDQSGNGWNLNLENGPVYQPASP